MFLFLSAHMAHRVYAKEQAKDNNEFTEELFDEHIAENNEMLLLQGFRVLADETNSESDTQTKTASSTLKETLEDESLVDMDENIEAMNLSNLKISENIDDDDDKIFSNIKESRMAVFDETVLEEELSEADDKPRHTPLNKSQCLCLSFMLSFR